MPIRKSPHLFCFGLGYTAQMVAARRRADGWRVSGSCRTSDKALALEREGYAAHLFDRDRPLDDPAMVLEGVTHILISIPPDQQGDPVVDQHARDLMACDGLAWIGYLSTTGVYGDRNGAWVDEDSELRPSSARSRRRVAAERAWLDLQRFHGLPVHVFRLAGIYGPGRSALDSVRSGFAKRIERPGHVFSRIHVLDIARALEASIKRPKPGRVYNVCDDLAAAPREVTEYACHLLGVEPPPVIPFDDAELSPMARSFWQDNRRVSNRRLHTELGIDLVYPDYKAGLQALLDAGA